MKTFKFINIKYIYFLKNKKKLLKSINKYKNKINLKLFFSYYYNIYEKLKI